VNGGHSREKKRDTFRSLRHSNYRLWFAGSIFSNLGTWIQLTAQDWLVLTELTDHDASAVGVVMALQFGPQFLLLPFTGAAADHFDKRTLLMTTQIAMAILSLALGVLVLSGMAQLWQVYLLAFLLGAAAAFDAPVRQTFVGNLVGERDLTNAIALNSSLNNAARMIGPALAGICIGALGTGWAFILNGLSYFALLTSLKVLQQNKLHGGAKPKREPGALFEGFRYVARRPDLRAIGLMLFVFGTFGLNFPIYVSTMAVTVFHSDPTQFGILSAAVAVGTFAGAFLATGQVQPRFSSLTSGAALFAIASALAAIAPNYWLFASALVLMGLAAITIMNRSNALMQISCDQAMRGRVMALRLAIVLGGTPIGAPLVGWVANNVGPRGTLAVAAMAGLISAIIGLWHQHRSITNAIS
jgi:MFS family permease